MNDSATPNTGNSATPAITPVAPAITPVAPAITPVVPGTGAPAPLDKSMQVAAPAQVAPTVLPGAPAQTTSTPPVAVILPARIPAPGANVNSVPPVAPTVVNSVPPVAPIPVVQQVDDNIYVADFFARGKQFQVEASVNPLVVPYVGRVMMSIFAEAGVGVLAQVSQYESQEPAQMVFIPFDVTTSFLAVARGVSKYSLASGATPVTDLGDGVVKAVAEFYPPFVEDLQRMAQQSAQRCADLPGGGQQVVEAAVTDFSPQFSANTIFLVASSSNPTMQRYVGCVFKSLGATINGVMAVGDQNSGVNEAVFLPFDGTTDFTLNPPGTYTFVNGIQQSQPVYNVQTQTYVSYDVVCPTYIPAPVVYYDPLVVPVAVGVAAAVVATELIFDPWYYPSYGYYDPYYW